MTLGRLKLYNHYMFNPINGIDTITDAPLLLGLTVVERNSQNIKIKCLF